MRAVGCQSSAVGREKREREREGEEGWRVEVVAARSARSCEKTQTFLLFCLQFRAPACKLAPARTTQCTSPHARPPARLVVRRARAATPLPRTNERGQGAGRADFCGADPSVDVQEERKSTLTPLPRATLTQTEKRQMSDLAGPSGKDVTAGFVPNASLTVRCVFFFFAFARAPRRRRARSVARRRRRVFFFPAHAALSRHSYHT
jgi:hypothetical protein